MSNEIISEIWGFTRWLGKQFVSATTRNPNVRVQPGHLYEIEDLKRFENAVHGEKSVFIGNTDLVLKSVGKGSGGWPEFQLMRQTQSGFEPYLNDAKDPNSHVFASTSYKAGGRPEAAGLKLIGPAPELIIKPIQPRKTA